MENKVIEVRFSDVLAMLLKASKVILLLVLILGLLGGLYGVYTVLKVQPQVTQGDVDAAEQSVAIAEQNLAKKKTILYYRNEVNEPGAWERLERCEQLIQQMQDYMKKSIYYRMDPLNRGAAHLRFAVEMDDVSAASDRNAFESQRAGIVVAYTKMFPFDSQTTEHIREIMGVETETRFVEELISITCDEEYHVVEICVCFDDLQVAEQVASYLYDTMMERAADILPKHQTRVLTTFSGYEADWEMGESHAAHEETLRYIEKVLLVANESIEMINDDPNKEQKAVNAAEAQLRAAQTALENAKTNHTKHRPSLRNMAKRAIKYGVLGAILGAVCGCIYALVKGLFIGIVQNQNEMMSRYSFPVIGVLPRTKKIWFDTTIRKLEGEPIGDREAITQAIVQSLFSRVGNRSVCLVSTGGHTMTDKFAVYTDGRVTSCGNIIDNPEAVKELSDCDGVVFVEQRGKSRIDLIDAEVLRAKALQKDIVGMVLI